jgi:hypothetical protein
MKVLHIVCSPRNVDSYNTCFSPQIVERLTPYLQGRARHHRPAHAAFLPAAGHVRGAEAVDAEWRGATALLDAQLPLPPVVPATA